MKNPPLIWSTLGALTLAAAPFAEAAYTENGKPVISRNGMTAKTEVPVSAEKKEAVAKTPPAEEKTDVPELTTHETPEKKTAPEQFPANVPAEKETQISTAVPVLEKIEETPAVKPENNLPEEDPSDVIPGPTKKEHPKNSFVVSGFYGFDESDTKMNITGLTFGYERVLADSRCNECGLGNVLTLTLKLDFGVGETENDESDFYFHNYSYNYSEWGYGSVKYDEFAIGFATVGFTWIHQLGKRIALALGIFGGIEYMSVDWTEHGYRNRYDRNSGYYDTTFSDSGNAADFSLCCGGNVALIFDFNDHHGIEIGADFYASTEDFDDVPAWNAPVWIMAKIGYRYSF